MKKSIKNEIVVGYPFVSHVDQLARPELTVGFLDAAYTPHYSGNDNLMRSGVYKLMGYAYNFRPYLKQFVYKQYGSWHEIFAPNKTTVRKIIYGSIDKIVEVI